MHPILEETQYIKFRAKPNVPLHDSGYKLIEDIKGETYDFVSINYSGIDGRLGGLMIDIDRNGWIKIWDSLDSKITKINDILPLKYALKSNILLDADQTKDNIQRLLYSNWANNK